MQYLLRKGLEIGIEGCARSESVKRTDIGRVALTGSDYGDVRPRVEVAVGDRVRAGQTLFRHRRYPEICYVAPASGVVRVLSRGSRRRLESLVIDVHRDQPIRFSPFDREGLSGLDSETVRARLLESGFWGVLRARPYDRVPGPEVRPRAVFVTAMDTQPLAPDPMLIIDREPDLFRDGLTVLSRLGAAAVHVCVASGSQVALPQAETIKLAEFAGPHPAGLPGTHIHALDYTIGPAADLWHIGYQDVIDIGRLFTTGSASFERVIGVVGPAVTAPQLVRVPVGASLGELLEGRIEDGAAGFSGGVLGGRAGAAYLGRFHNQVTVLAAARIKVHAWQQALELLWHGRTATATVRNEPQPSRKPAGMLPLKQFDDVWPFATPTAALLRALLTGDEEAALALGCLGLAEDDLALCNYVCAAGQDYAAALRRVLDRLAASE